jgi:tryptophan synthase beta chain
MDSKMLHDQPSLAAEADPNGMFGAFGGAYMPETLMPAVAELAEHYAEARCAPDFWHQYRQLLQDYVGRPSPLFLAHRLSAESGGVRIFLKREDLNHTGAHKINNCIGQILLARRMGKHRVVAETGAGQHGVATASVCALFGVPCVIYMGRHDMERQQPNVKRMELLGARVQPVDTGSATLKDAMNEALRDWITHVEDTYYLLGTGAGPHPYPQMVCDFQQVIGREAREQFLRLTGALPDALVACVGGGSNAAGLFIPFLADNSVKLYGVEAAGRGLDSGEHAASLQRGRPGVLHGNWTYLLQDEDGQIMATHSVSAGLDYPGIGPLHAEWFESGRVSYGSATDDEAVAAYHWLSRCEGILPALESAHALAFARRLVATLPTEAAVIVNLSGRGDKDVETVLNFAAMGREQ